MPRVAALCLAFLSAPVFAASSTILPNELALEQVVGGLSLPVAVRSTPDPADTRLFVVQQGGQIRIVQNGSVLATPFLNIQAASGGTAPPFGFTDQNSHGERGLLGLAFHPDYASNGRFFIAYTDGNGDSVVARYQVSGNANVANPAGTAVLHIDQDFANHNGGDIAFGPDDLLYIPMGDGGDGNDPCNRAQTLLIANLAAANSCAPDNSFNGNGGNANSRALLGKVLRIDVDGTSTGGGEVCGDGGGSANYAIPAGNPYGGADGICNEVWHAGMRNPFRFSFDRANGDMYLGDVGQQDREEIDFAPAGVSGLNFGWRCREGDIAGANQSGCPAPTSFVEPIFAYDRSLGSTVTGGYRYRGPQAALEGVYFYADFGSGRIWAARPYNGVWQNVMWQNTSLMPSSFGEGSDGELYVLHYGGTLQRFTTPYIFRDGAEAND